MARRNNRRSRGLILLVVLGMLTLFSFLAVTYVVYAGQSRTASMAMSARDNRGTPPDKLMDYAIKQVIRGTTDTHSVLFHNSLLEDLNGVGDGGVTLRARTNQWDNPARAGFIPMYNPSALPALQQGQSEGPQLYGGHLLKIPLQWSNSLPRLNDAWTGRVVSFQGGPLSGHSLRVVRYIGEVPATNVAQLTPYLGVQYSIIVDLSEVTQQLLPGAGGSTRTITQWATQEANGAALVYSNFASGSALTGPYSILLNGSVFNSFGAGISNNGTVATATSSNKTFYPGTNLQSPFFDVEESLLPNHAYITSNNPGFTASGDLDEPYDAADYQNFFLAMTRQSSSTLTCDEIIPSFHRPAVIQHIAARYPNGTANGSINLSTMTNPTAAAEFVSFLDLVQRASGRPISCRISNFPTNGQVLQLNPYFTGNSPVETAPASKPTYGNRNPQLVFDWANRNNEQANFDAWLRWQTRGSWDVDNDGDGLNDSVWVDLNFPLMTSPEGKLLKILVAFYIEDMDGKLDLNAAGSQFQSSPGFALPLNDSAYALRQNNASMNWPQGLGAGSGDISLSHLFQGGSYPQVLMRRYAGAPGMDNVDDAGSSVVTRGWRRKNDNAGILPMLPFSMQGQIGLAVDLLGNTRVMNDLTATGRWNEATDDPYDSRILRNPHGDNPFSASEYERLVRFNDWDHSSQSRDLERITGTSFAASSMGHIRSISPRNASLTLPSFPGTYTDPLNSSTNVPISSFPELVEALVQNRFAGQSSVYPYIANNVFAQLFPLEFRQNRPLDLNRPLGNGADEDSDGAVDEADELTQPNSQTSIYWDPTNGNLNYTGVSEDYQNDAAGTTFDPSYIVAYRGDESRQLLARHLYCLAQLILPVDSSGNNTYVFPNQEDPVGSPTPVNNATRARILAQWAINVVDFRDNDAAMTRFPYDEDPFHDAMGNFNPSWQPDNSHVVFGMEQPELLLTESLATHDIRVQKIPGNPPQYKQLRIPEGSLFLELLCPKSIASPTATNAADSLLPGGATSLYDSVAGGLRGLDIGRTVQDPTTNVNYPVWQVLVVDPSWRDGSSHSMEEIYNSTDRYKYSYQVGAEQAGQYWETGNTMSTSPTVDRVIWFSNLAPSASNPFTNGEVSKVFRFHPKFTRDGYKYDQNPVFLRGGQYLVVGPRPETFFGSQTPPGSGRPNKPNYHRIRLIDSTGTQNWVQMFDAENNPALWVQGSAYASTKAPPDMGRFVGTCATMVLGAGVDQLMDPWPDLDTNDMYPPIIGMNISEPLPKTGPYYNVPTSQLDSGDTTGDNKIPANGFHDMPADAYIDMASATNSSEPVADVGKFLTDKGWNLQGMDYPRIESRNGWSAAVLQRLANPERPWHAVLNPYLTVDWIPIDLTVFSGEEETLNANANIRFASRQKSGLSLALNQPVNPAADPMPGTRSSTFYSYHSEPAYNASQPIAPTTADPMFKYALPMEITVASNAMQPYTYLQSNVRGKSGTEQFVTLGYLNRRFDLRGVDSTSKVGYPALADSRYLGAPGLLPDSPTSPPTADPNRVLPPVSPYFANRDYVNAMELASVPLSSPGAFMQEFYTPVIASGSLNQYPMFRHVMDFEQIYGPPASSSNKKTAGMLLDMVGVNSPWPDAWTVINPVSQTVGPTGSARDYAMSAYKAPYNWIPSYREPGRINLNTMEQDDVIRGLIWNSIAPLGASSRDTVDISAFTTAFRNSRTGTTFSAGNGTLVSGNDHPHLDRTFPTEFPAVYTATMAVDKFPRTDMQTYNAANETLLRRRNVGQRMFSAADIPAFQLASPPFGPGGDTTLANSTFFQNYPAARLANLTTTKSNVYSVRMTLGYFEFDSANGIGVEYGSEQGRSKRNRAFYLIDRSIPVGFQVGIDNNVEQTILSRRIVE